MRGSRALLCVQDDRLFTFRFNVMVSDGGSERMSHPLSAVCSGPSWIQREIVCEEDYMEVRRRSGQSPAAQLKGVLLGCRQVNVRREASCAARPGPAGQAQRAALSQVTSPLLKRKPRRARKVTQVCQTESF